MFQELADDRHAVHLRKDGSQIQGFPEAEPDVHSLQVVADETQQTELLPTHPLQQVISQELLARSLLSLRLQMRFLHQLS